MDITYINYNNKKELALRGIQKYYSEGYITANERKALFDKLNIMTFNYSQSTILSIPINVDGRDILFTSGYLFIMTVYDSQGNTDFTVNYNYENDKFLITEYDTYYVNQSDIN